MGVLQSFVQNYVKYANMEGFCRDNYISNDITLYLSSIKTYSEKEPT